MGPRKKKSKPNPQAPASASAPAAPSTPTPTPTPTPQQQDRPPQGQTHPQPPSTATTDPATASRERSDPQTTPQPAGSNQATSDADPAVAADSDTQPTRAKPEKAPARASWYNGGSWRSKASPVAQATRESISVAGGATSEALAEGTKHAARYMHNTLKRSSTFSTKSIPIAACETKVNAKGSTDSNTDADRLDLDMAATSDPKDTPKDVKQDRSQNDRDAGAPPPDAVQDPPLPPTPANDGDAASAHSQKPAQSSAGWFGWWSRPDGYATDAEKSQEQDTTPQPEISEAHFTPLPPTPGPTPTQDADTLVATSGDTTPPIPIGAKDQSSTTRSNKNLEYGSTRSWFGLWSSTQNQQSEQPENLADTQQPLDTAAPADSPPTEQIEIAQTEAAETKLKDDSPKGKSSGWAFWSRERTDGEAPTPNGTQRQVGELAVADTPSQSHPEVAQFNEGRDQKNKTKKPSKKECASKEPARNQPSDTNSVLPPRSPPQPRPKMNEAVKALEATKAAPVKSLKPQCRPNLILPSFRDTYSPAYIPTYWERITQYVGSSLRLVDSPAGQGHVSINPSLPKVKNAIAIGVHGYFPAPLIQKVLGQPTGTSIRFANYASAAIRTWTEQNQPDTPCEIETVALEGEGFISDRVNTLWKLLLNWLSHLRQADLILVACHSQGVPVAIMLVSKLIQLGCLSPSAKIGICAMAGVNLGPFADYKSRLLGAGSAAELFEFSRPGSKVSQDYAHALEVVLRHNVRITYCGSIDDQLVSLESSTFATLTHPYVYRCVFIDGRLHAPDFITHLVAFALKLRNLGISDHGLIRELSLPLAGSLYGGEGHSRVYDDPAVYKLALEFTLETTSIAPTAGNAKPTPPGLERRGSERGMPASVSAANAMRRGSVSATTLPGIAPVLAPYETPASGANANPFFLPWAMRGIVEEETVKRDMGEEIKNLVALFEEWRPVSKVLKDVRFRLEAVRSKL
ncbi:hypothetical protein MBLNU459_g4725t1 [Dothideomycetes sp. NU459]